MWTIVITLSRRDVQVGPIWNTADLAAQLEDILAFYGDRVLRITVTHA